jgi:hypothetical protein
MASNIGLPEGFEVEYMPNDLPEGFEVEYTPIDKKGISFRSIGQSIGNALAAPIVAQKENLPLQEAYNIASQRTEDVNNEPINKVGNAIGDFALNTSFAALPALNVFKGANALTKGGNFLTNAAIQGGLPGLIEGAQEGNALGGGATGTTIAAGVQSLPGIAKLGGWTFKHAFPGLKAKTVEQLIKPNSKALDLTEETAQNLLMDTTERIQKDYRNLIDSAGRAVNEASLRLPEERGVFASSLKNSLNDIYSGHSVSGVEGLNPAYDVAGDVYNDLINKIDLASDVKDIGRVSAPKLADIMNNIKNYNIDWNKSNAKERQALLKQIYGDFSRRLGNLSPELKKANKEYSKLAKFDDNEGLKQIINPSVIDGNKIDSASSALRNYNSTVTKGNTNRNIQDLEKLLVSKGKQPFLNDIDDVNAANELLKTAETGLNPFGLTDKLKNIVERPILLTARKYNQVTEPIINKLSDKVSPEIRKLLTPFAVQTTTPLLYGEVSNY